MAARRLGGGGRGTRAIRSRFLFIYILVNSFHATPIGVMFNVENIAGDRSPVPRGSGAHGNGDEPSKSFTSTPKNSE